MCIYYKLLTWLIFYLQFFIYLGIKGNVNCKRNVLCSSGALQSPGHI